MAQPPPGGSGGGLPRNEFEEWTTPPRQQARRLAAAPKRELSRAVTHPARKRGVGGILPPLRGSRGQSPLRGDGRRRSPLRGERGRPPPQRVSRIGNSSPPSGAQTHVPSPHACMFPLKYRNETSASRRARQVAYGTGAAFSRRPKARYVLCGHAPRPGEKGKALLPGSAFPFQLARAFKTALATLPAVSMPPEPSSTTTAKA